MLSMNDIINVSFRKSGFSGYKTDDVDVFIDQVRDTVDQMQKKEVEQDELAEKLKAENQQLTEKVKILADRVEQFRSEEDEIKNALISAQKVGDASVREARHRAEIILKDANLKAEHIEQEAQEKTVEQKREMERLQRSVSDFRARLLAAYKEHLTLIDALPSSKPEPQQETSPAPTAASEPQPEPKEEPEAAATEEAPEMFQADISCFEAEPAQN
ncbi:DivIVA domain-containing protein [Caproiciproducens sp. NJN-50]|uniref:DivIVA domain-containing protein n=1 Tax=Acutalibacteraceae TaxID=3082771 RepID=UPI000FFE270A|nr:MULTISPECIES: DivIVA domain-containing protein [Acutalibacteraceae]QAT49842.1 DivIVA domain-containing protein [Caproiciproducens sp. NJN-50]